MTGRQQHVAGGQVFAGLDDMLTGGRRAQDFDGGLIDRLGVLHHHHGVGAGRQHAAGVDELGGAGMQGPLGGGAHRDLAIHGEECRQPFGGAVGFGGANRVAVHGRAGERGAVFRRNERRGGDSSQGVVQLDALAARFGGHVGEQARQRFVRRHDLEEDVRRHRAGGAERLVRIVTLAGVAGPRLRGGRPQTGGGIGRG